MSLRTLPEAKSFQRPQNYQWDAPSGVLSRWAETPQAAADDSETTITMFEVIGEDFWTGGGVTAKRVGAALRAIGQRPVTVKINSPGGDLFEGIAIYNQLRAHKAKVTVEVLGMAASAASVIAMAGDEIVMKLGTFMMVHNAWGIVIGNRHDMREAAALFDGFDAALADIYEARSGSKRKDIVALLDREAWLSPSEAVDKGFADRVDAAAPEKDASSKNTADRTVLARRQAEAALARAGYTRNQRAELLTELGAPVAPRDASDSPPAQRDAGRIIATRDESSMAALRQLLATIKS